MDETRFSDRRLVFRNLAGSPRQVAHLTGLHEVIRIA